MSIVRLDEVRREIGDLVILDSITVALASGERVGLVGANGAGKTTLLRIIAGREEADAGRVHVSRGTDIGLLAQEAHLDRAFVAARSVRQVVRAGAAEVESMERSLAEMEEEGAGAVESAAYAELRERFEAADGYHLDQRVEAALSGLGIAADDWGRQPLELSGGEQTRVALARLLTADPDLLMLDEPTNHLDIAALEWLETALVRRDRALLLASHDRAFLDNVVDRIWEIRDRRLRSFKGAYSAFLLQREAADARARREVRATDTAMAHEEALVQRYRSQRKHVKMHEHERRLEQMRASRSDAPRVARRLSLPTQSLVGGGPARSAEVVVSLDGVLCGYAAGPGRRDALSDRQEALPGRQDALPGPPEAVPVIRAGHLEARRGDRIGLVGPNGAGKSTLLRTIAGQLPALDGYVRIGRNVMPGYLSQLRDQPLGGASVLDALLAAAPVTPGAARSYLARFLFRGDDVAKPVSELSGGERSRLELALLGISSTNLLLLDEPTNHLDIIAREALEAFLRDSDATLIVVSHDRRLLESLCERLWVVAPDAAPNPAIVAPFSDGYRAWRRAVADGWSAAAELKQPGAGRGPSRRAEATTAARRAAGQGVNDDRRSIQSTAPGHGGDGAPARLSKDVYRREHRRIEADLSRLGERKSALESGLEDPAVQANFVELRRLSTELAEVDAALAQAEDAWLVLQEQAPV